MYDRRSIEERTQSTNSVVVNEKKEEEEEEEEEKERLGRRIGEGGMEIMDGYAKK